jgi:8-oxo-dGTP pyrophosphatase MutT (NUDIX family)
VREEAGVDARIIAPLEVIEYWYVGNDREAQRVRFHKFVHLFLLEYEGGDVRDHDHEVEEARWVASDEAERMLSFESERRAMREAGSLLTTAGGDQNHV